MVSSARVIALLRPVAPEILAADDAAIAKLNGRKAELAGLDRQPAAASLAFERRAIVGTRMRRSIAPSFDWEQADDDRAGAYAWRTADRIGDVIIRMAKTTAESRREDAKALLGIQDTLFELPAHPESEGDVVLIRLMGGVFTGASVDVVAVGARGALGPAIPLRAIASGAASQLLTGRVPQKTGIRLPPGIGIRRSEPGSA